MFRTFAEFNVITLEMPYKIRHDEFEFVQDLPGIVIPLQNIPKFRYEVDCISLDFRVLDDSVCSRRYMSLQVIERLYLFHLATVILCHRKS